MNLRNFLKKYYVYLIFIIAFTVRLIHLNCYITNPAFDFPLGGHATYVNTALKIIKGDLLGGTDAFYDNSPIYSYIVAALFKVFGIDFYMTRFIQILIGSLNCCLIALLTCHFFGVRSAIIAGTMASFFGPLIFYDAEIIVLSWVVCFCLIALILLVKSNCGNRLNIFFVGIFCGLAIMGRPNLLLFPGLLLFHFYFQDSDVSFKDRTLSFTALWIGVLVVMIPFSVRNYVVSGEMIWLNPTGGHNFYLGHHADAKPYYTQQYLYKGPIYLKYKSIAEKEMNRTLSHKETSAFWYQKGLKSIINNPFNELKLIWGKICFFFNDMEMPTYFDYYFSKKYSFILKYGVISFGFLFPMSILGFIISIPRFKELLPLYLFFLTTFFSVLLIFYISRVRIPAIPVFIIFAAYGVFTLIKWVQLQKYKHLVITVGVSVLLYMFTFLPLAGDNFAVRYNHVGVIQWQKGDILEAEASFLKALELQPNFKYAYLNLIRMFQLNGNSAKTDFYRQKYNKWKMKSQSESIDNSAL